MESKFHAIDARHCLSFTHLHSDVLCVDSGSTPQIRQNDRLAISKLVTTMTRSIVRSPLAHCVLIRYTCQVSRPTRLQCGSSVALVKGDGPAVHHHSSAIFAWAERLYNWGVPIMHLGSRTGDFGVWKSVCHLTLAAPPHTGTNPLPLSQVIEEMGRGGGNDRPFFDFLESSLRNKSDVVVLEAARAIVGLSDVTSRELTPAITVLQMFLSSPKPVLRFAAIRTLNKVGAFLPVRVLLDEK